MALSPKMQRALDQMRAASQCEHDFEYVGPFARGEGDAVVAKCRRCRCRFTSWPDSVHYAEIIAARDRQNLEMMGG